MRSPEAKNFDEKIDIDRAFDKARKILETETINPEEFSDLYGENNVRKDKEYVEKREAEFSKKKTPEDEEVSKLAAIFETIIYEHIEQSDWFGPNATTIKSSRYDDIKNGVDCVVEFQESEASASHLALAIDVTFSPDTHRKFERIKKEIEKGELTRVKYFVSEHLNFRGELLKIPKVVVGTNAGTVKELMELWLAGRQKELGQHPVQTQILEEILSQMETFERYARQVKQPEIAERYKKIGEIVNEIYKQKQKTTKTGIRDKFFYAILDELKNFIGVSSQKVIKQETLNKEKSGEARRREQENIRRRNFLNQRSRQL